MAKVVTPLTCRVMAIGRPKESSYSPGQFYHPVLFADTCYPEGDEQAKLWKNLSADEVALIHKGDLVQLVPIGTDKQGKVKHQILLMTPAHTVSASLDVVSDVLSQADWSNEHKREIAAYVEQQANLLKFCWSTARAKLEGVVTTEESMRCAASTLFIAASKKFGL